MTFPDSIDISLVSSRRPHLLDLMLRSFRMNLLRKVNVRRLVVNIDPIWGNEFDAGAVKTVCRLYFDEVEIREPESPSFGAAVKWLWSRMETEWFLHLEDDWCLMWPIDVERLKREMAEQSVGMISLYNHGKAWRKGVWPDRFTTSPSFVRNSFGRTASGLMNPALDPEKQFYNQMNPALAEAVSSYRHRFHGSRFAPVCIVDMGREWREARQIEKTLVAGESVWSRESQACGQGEDRRLVDRYYRRLCLSRFLPSV